MKQNQVLRGTTNVPAAGMLAALGVILTYVEIPLPFMPPFMKIDISDVPSMIAFFVLGFPTALFVTAVKDIIHLFVSDSLGIGEICNFFVTLTYLSLFRMVMRYGKWAGYGAAILAMTAVAAFLNVYVLLPLYFAAFHIDQSQLLALTRATGNPVESLTGYILLVVVPFNLIKGTLIALVSEVVRRRVQGADKG